MPDAHAIVLACDDDYLKPTVVAARSALRSTDRELRVFVVGLDLNDASVSLLRSRIGLPLELIPFPPGKLDMLPWTGRPASVWVRLFIGSIIPADVSRAVWIDSDMLVRGPIDQLLDTRLQEMTIAACRDYWIPTHADSGIGLSQVAGTPQGMTYFNAGMLVVDLDRWRADGVEDALVSFAGRSEVVLENADQDVLNAVMWDAWLPLPQTWNYPAQFVSNSSFASHIVHFFGARKPWVVACENAHFQREYRKAAKEIGWVVPRPQLTARRAARLLTPQIVRDLREQLKVRGERRISSARREASRSARSAG